ncbi:hypothetical protein ACIBCN_19380 [Nocardia sp. NPDC051052]|uniref:hypothetical protein n=1 Tax=Nocardia sp. NPDC051052 TaxID=3364322 RepID=UPI0037BBABA9
MIVDSLDFKVGRSEAPALPVEFYAGHGGLLLDLTLNAKVDPEVDRDEAAMGN